MDYRELIESKITLYIELGSELDPDRIAEEIICEFSIEDDELIEKIENLVNQLLEVQHGRVL